MKRKPKVTIKVTTAAVLELVKFSEEQAPYSYDNYASWSAVCKWLLEQGYTKHEAAAVLSSKHMRWAADRSNKRYGKNTAKDFAAYWAAYLGDAKEVEELVVGTFGTEYLPPKPLPKVKVPALESSYIVRLEVRTMAVGPLEAAALALSVVRASKPGPEDASLTAGEFVVKVSRDHFSPHAWVAVPFAPGVVIAQERKMFGAGPQLTGKAKR